MSTRPYLDSLDVGPERITTVLEWGRYLGDTFGASGALNALQYYERIGWIDDGVRLGMVTYIRGMSHEEIHSKSYDDPETLEEPLSALSGTPFAVHARSLSYIAEITGEDLDVHLVLADLASRRANGPTAQQESEPEPQPIDVE